MSHSNKKSKGIKTVSLLTLIAAAAAGQAYAADGSDASTVQDLDQRVRILERQLETQKEDADAKAKETATVSAGSNGFAIKSANGDYSLELHALVQADGRFYLQGQNSSANNQFLLRRVEPTLTGNLGKYVGFTITPEFGSSSATTPTGTSSSSPTSNLLDYYVELRFDPAATLRLGRFKEPVGLENLQSTQNILFIERGLAIDLEPNRDIGAQLQGKLLSNTLTYQVGIFNGAADGGDAPSGNTDNHFDLAARIFAEPFKNSPGILQGLGIGVAGTRGSAVQGVGSATANSPATGSTYLSTELIASSGGNYVSPGQLKIFSYSTNTYANGLRSHFSPQAYWYYNSFGILTEYVTSTQTVNAAVAGAAFAANKRLTNSAFQVAGSYVLTGEDATYNGVKPRRPFRVGSDGWGAFEIGARYSGLNIDSAAYTADGGKLATAGVNSVQGAREYGVAANWYLNSNTKVSLNYEDTHFKDVGGAAATTFRPDERALLVQAQIYY